MINKRFLKNEKIKRKPRMRVVNLLFKNITISFEGNNQLM